MDKKYRVVEHVGGGFSIQEACGIDAWKGIGSVFYMSVKGVYAFLRSRSINIEDVDFTPVLEQITKSEYYHLLVDVEVASGKLVNADNNKAYYASLRALVRKLDAFQEFFAKYPDFRNPDRFPRRAKKYREYFLRDSHAGFSFYERVLNSVEEYQHGNKPF